MRGCERLDDLGAQSADTGKGGRFVIGDQARVADDIGCQDCGETTILPAHDQFSVTTSICRRGLADNLQPDLSKQSPGVPKVR